LRTGRYPIGSEILYGLAQEINVFAEPEIKIKHISNP